MFFETTPDGVEVHCLDESCTAFIRDPGGACSIAVADLNVWPEPFTWWVARVLVANPDNRSKGYGTKVLQAALNAILVSAGHMARVIVAPGGYGADADPEQRIRFYEKNGFKRVNDERLMEWRCLPESH